MLVMKPLHDPLQQYSIVRTTAHLSTNQFVLPEVMSESSDLVHAMQSMQMTMSQNESRRR